MYSYYKYAVITLIWFISAISFASGNIQKTTDTFNFKNLSNQKHYGALDYGVYDPAKVIKACTKMPVGGIWPADPTNTIPSPEPTASDCEISTQMAYGCNNYDSNTGRALTKSVVGIMIQRLDKPNEWELACTGTIIDNQWVLTAAHCVVKDTNTSLINARSLIVVPWQDLHQTSTYFGVPTILNQDAFGAYNIIKVRAVNIPQAYTNVFINAYSPDLALLKIEPITPHMGLEPIPVANQSFLSEPDTPVIMGGYGRKEDDEMDGQLRYRKSYYMTNIYDSNWHGGISNNYGNIYSLDSKPIEYKGVNSAWSFSGPGDSGAPVLSYNSLTHKFQIEGVHSSGLFCGYPGYFAKLPYPYSIAASTTYPQNYNFIKSVIHGTATPSKVRCQGECYFKTLYVINQTDNSINSYKFDHHNNLLLGLTTPTGNYPTQIAFRPGKNTAFITNFMSNSISQYELNSEGGLTYQKNIYLPSGQSSPVDIIFLSSKYMFVLAHNSNSLLQYDLKFTGNWHLQEEYQTLMNPTHLNIIWIDRSEYLAVSNEKEVALYKWDQAYKKLVNTVARLALTSSMGKLIEIKPFGDPNNQKLYVLTTKGVYVYRPNKIDEGVVIFTLIEKLLDNFPPDSHLVPLYANSFAISSRFLDRVFVYELAHDNTIALENYITMPEPGEMAFYDDVLYISSFPRSLYSYTISYPSLHVSTEPKVVETGLGPTIVKINKLNFSEM
jgi:hypothetical protein